jgi:hypothetical protein
VQNLERGWRTSPAGPNEDCGMELSGIGERPGSSGASGALEVGGGGYSVFVGNQTEQAKDGEI